MTDIIEYPLLATVLTVMLMLQCCDRLSPSSVTLCIVANSAS